ncbi:hypothetical protein Tco_1405967 [Tanacetum coccineum]
MISRNQTITGQITYPTTYKVPEENKASKEDMDECHKLLTNKVDLSIPEGHQIPQNIYDPLPLEDHQIADANSQCDQCQEKDFRNLHPNDFEDLFLLNIQEKLNHLPKTDKTSLHTAVNMWIRNLVIRNRVGDLQLGIESYQTKINLERPNWDAADYYFKEDYTIVPKPRAVYEYNKGMETRKWSEDDKRRSKDFITAIEKRLQIRRIFRSLESFVGGRIRDIDYRLINRTT